MVNDFIQLQYYQTLKCKLNEEDDINKLRGMATTIMSTTSELLYSLVVSARLLWTNPSKLQIYSGIDITNISTVCTTGILYDVCVSRHHCTLPLPEKIVLVSHIIHSNDHGTLN